MQDNAMQLVQAYIEERVEFHLKAMQQQANLRALRAELLLANYSSEAKDKARNAWWSFCEQCKELHVPTFREFWNDESTYEMVL